MSAGAGTSTTLQMQCSASAADAGGFKELPLVSEMVRGRQALPTQGYISYGNEEKPGGTSGTGHARLKIDNCKSEGDQGKLNQRLMGPSPSV